MGSRAWPVVLGAVTVATVVGAGAAGPDMPKKDPGIYVATKTAAGQEELTRIRGGRSQDMKTHGVGKSIATQGFTKPTMSVELAGTTADVHTSTTPVFYIYLNSGAASNDPAAMFAQMMGGDTMPVARTAADFSMVQTKVTEDGRTIDLGKIGGSKPKNAIDTVVERLQQGVYRVKPKKPLVPGEYAFVFAGGMGGTAWDFAVEN